MRLPWLAQLVATELLYQRGRPPRAIYTLKHALQMLHAGRYIYVIFMSHMALEKTLKALVTEETQQLPPRTHNLIDLAQRATVVLSQAQQDFLGRINNTSVVVRYPGDLSTMISQYPE